MSNIFQEKLIESYVITENLVISELKKFISKITSIAQADTKKQMRQFLLKEMSKNKSISSNEKHRN